MERERRGGEEQTKINPGSTFKYIAMRRGIAKKPCILFFFFLVIFSHIFATRDAKEVISSRKPCKRLVLYWQETMFNGNNVGNASAAVIANSNGTGLGPFNFGKTVVFDDPITADKRYNSPPVARAQGFYFCDMKTTYNIWTAYSLVFNSTLYKGTLNIMGADMMNEANWDLSIVGGIGDFFMTRGIVTFRTDEVEIPDYFRIEMDIKLYECY